MTDEKKVKEPLFHIVKREAMPKWKVVLIYSVAIFAALIIVGIFCSLTTTRNKDVFDLFSSTFEGAFGTERRRWIYLRSSFLLLGVSLALLPAFKMKFWNLGANGQIVVGALVTFACLNWAQTTGQSNALIVVMIIIFGTCAGVVWAVIPAIFKAIFRTNETLFTLMMNYIAQGLVTVMITIWAPKGSGSLSPITEYGLPDLINKYLLPVFVIAVLAVFIYFYITKSKHGYELALVGESENTARYAGINVKKVLIRTLALSGGICGMMGVLLAGNVDHTVSTTIHSNMGFTAIMTVWLAGFNPIITIGTCFLITFISTGMGQVKQDFGFTNDAITNVALGFTFFLIIACFFFINYKLVFRKRKTEAPSLNSSETATADEGGKE